MSSAAKPAGTGRRGRPRKYGNTKQQQQQKAAKNNDPAAASLEATGVGGKKSDKNVDNSSKQLTEEQVSALLIRDDSQGIAPRGILTGYYTSQGTRMRHTVHDGALKLPRNAVELLDQVTKETKAALTTKGDEDGEGADENLKLPAKYELPGLDSVIRPCLDPKLIKITVTELSATTIKVATTPTGASVSTASSSEQQAQGLSNPPQQEQQQGFQAQSGNDANTSDDNNTSTEGGGQQVVVNVARTKAVNRVIDRSWLLPRKSNEGSTSEPSITRIRGGGGGGVNGHDQSGGHSNQYQQPNTAGAAAAAAAALIQGRQQQQQQIAHHQHQQALAPAPLAPAPPHMNQPAPQVYHQHQQQQQQQQQLHQVHHMQVAPAVAPVPINTNAVPTVNTSMPGASSRNVTTVQVQQHHHQQQVQQHQQYQGSNVPVAASPMPAPAPAPSPAPAAVQMPTPPTPASAANAAPTTAAVPSAKVATSGITTSAHAAAAATTPAATPVTSSSTTKTAASDDAATATTTKSEPASSSSAAQVKVEALKKRPAPQWEQFKPGPNDETITPAELLTPKPSWYHSDKISSLERTMLPEWFNGSASHRTPAFYKKTRERMIHISSELANRNLTNAIIRRSIVGDVGSLHRLRNFLVEWGLINEDGINDSAPTPATLREELASSSANKKQKRGAVTDGQIAIGANAFNAQLRSLLLRVVIQQSKEVASDGGSVVIDWDHVAEQIGHGVSASDCEREFLTMPLCGGSDKPEGPETAVAAAPAPTSATSDQQSRVGSEEAGMIMEEFRQQVFLDLARESNPAVVSAVVRAALQATDNNLPEAQKAALIGLVSSRALEHARSEEAALSSTLSELVSQRMQKLENRMAMMDDIEGMLEAERVALELERRDLYTARCRHWFGGS